jgi:hypothetical protein
MTREHLLAIAYANLGMPEQTIESEVKALGCQPPLTTIDHDNALKLLAWASTEVKSRLAGSVSGSYGLSDPASRIDKQHSDALLLAAKKYLPDSDASLSSTPAPLSTEQASKCLRLGIGCPTNPNPIPKVAIPKD